MMRKLVELSHPAAVPVPRNRFNHGFTIVQIMLILFVAGIMGALVVDLIIDRYCEEDPSSTLCEDTQQLKPGLRVAADGLETAPDLR